jgi:hypothetical protein
VKRAGDQDVANDVDGYPEIVAGRRGRRLQRRLQARDAPASVVDIDGAAPGHRAAVTVGSHHDGAPVDGDCPTELVATHATRSNELDLARDRRGRGKGDRPSEPDESVHTESRCKESESHVTPPGL